jgi:parallel beta-helix repeat protein
MEGNSKLIYGLVVFLTSILLVPLMSEQTAFATCPDKDEFAQTSPQLGDIIVSDPDGGSFDDGAILGVNPVSGEITVIADSCISESLDEVNFFDGDNEGLAFSPIDGKIYVANHDNVFRVDPITGSTELVSEGQFFTAECGEEGFSDGDIEQVAVLANGDIIAVGDQFCQEFEDDFSRVIKIDPDTGVQTLIAEGDPLIDGELFDNPEGVDIGDDGTIFVADEDNGISNDGQILSVDPDTGSTAIISAVVEFGDIVGVLTGSLFAVDEDAGCDNDGAIWEINPDGTVELIAENPCFVEEGCDVINDCEAVTEFFNDPQAIDLFGEAEPILLSQCGELGVSGATYILQSDIDNIEGTCFEITAHEVTLDGNNKKITSNECDSSVGVLVENQVDVTIKDITVQGFHTGIELSDTGHSSVLNSVANDNCFAGIYLHGYISSHSNTVEGNTANNNGLDELFEAANAGILLENSHYNVIKSNTANQNIFGIELIDSHENLVDNNTVNQNFIGISVAELNDEGGANIVAGNNLDDNDLGIGIGASLGNLIGAKPATEEPGDDGIGECTDIFVNDDFIVDGNTITNSVRGLVLFSSGFNCIVGNQISGSNEDAIFDRDDLVLPDDFDGDGIGLIESGINVFARNVVWNNDGDGVHTIDSDFNIFDRNRVQDNGDEGIEMDNSNQNSLTCNAAGFNEDGFDLEDGSSQNEISGNVFFNNEQSGVDFDDAITSSNVVDHNDFIGHEDHVDDEGSANSFFHNWYDDGNGPGIQAMDAHGLCDGVPDIPVTTSSSGGGDNQWPTRPTFGVSHEDYQSQIVESGFSFNGEYFTITDNYHTDFAEQSVEIGTVNTFSATVYADKGLWVQEFLFGVPGIGEGHLAELGVEVWYDTNGEIDEVKVVQNSDVIDVDTVSVSHEKTNCTSTDEEAKCDTTTVSMTFLESLIDKVMIIGAIDNERRIERTSLNEGFDISGESLNPMLSNMIPSNVKNEGLLQVTQMAKYSPYWVAENGRMFEMNSFGSFKEINQSFERFQDSGTAYTRMHSGFGGIIAYEQDKATEIYDSSNYISELPESFAYIYPETGERITEEIRQEMLMQEEIAQAILDEMDRQSRHY